MAAGPDGPEDWVGSAYLFVESSLDKVVLSDVYAQPQCKVTLYRALRTALAGAWIYRPQRGRGRPACLPLVDLASSCLGNCLGDGVGRGSG